MKIAEILQRMSVAEEENVILHFCEGISGEHMSAERNHRKMPRSEQ